MTVVRRRLKSLSVLLSVFLSASAVSALDSSVVDQVDFEQQVLPVLRSHCFDCHGEETRESQLRLDRKWALLRGGDSGEPAVLPGDAEGSYLIQLVSGAQPDKVMPPKDVDDVLTSDEIAVLKKWIEQGAHWPGPYGADQPSDEEVAASELNHWAFQPVRQPEIPQVPESWPAEWRQNPIDAFIAKGLVSRDLQPSKRADRATLARRLSLVMLGLPPRPKSVRAFSDNDLPEAWNNLVERTLQSSHYGERWARYWLDLVRFAETDGFETNRERPNAWPYRDYVIRSFNDDKPYDQFLREQLVGDAIGVPEATAYLVAGPVDIVKSPDIALTLMQRQNELDDMINTTSTAFLGMTVGCARCHNHKFDPIRQTDYYGLQAIFTGVRHGNRSVPPSMEQQIELKDLDAEVARLRGELKPFLKRNQASRPAVASDFNEELFEPVETQIVRFTITSTTGAQPCLDELEVFSGVQNVALASTGAVATCSTTLPGYEIHQLKHINDGLYGNSHSWISNESGAGWVQIEFPEPRSIHRIVWGRDREKKFRDRLAVGYKIEIATRDDQWREIASSDDRQPYSGRPSPVEYDFTGLSDAQAMHGRQLLERINAAEERRRQLRDSSTVYAGTFEAPQPTYRLFRGEPMAKREQVSPSAIEVLGDLGIDDDTSEQQRRKALADWITSPENPLTARVIVNRIWQWHFGQALVSTPSDFGKGGVKPTHPELLDFLAWQLMDHDWSVKHIHRLILTSATWQQAGSPNDAGMLRDAGCQLWWRFPPRRLEAEPIRDSILSVTGLLNLKMYGPGFSAFEVEMENVRHYHPKSKYSGDDFRRMIYQTKVRQEQDSVFGIFDCPDAASSVPRRSRSTTPLQALNLMNSSFVLQQSAAFAERLRADHSGDTSKHIQHAFLLCFARQPTPDELTDSLSFIDQYGLTAFCRAMLNSNEFLFIP
ncbi:MAG: PSD1 and planctomycete cytochrome C domain-containing protein [Planctomycetaceae bacterium]